MKKYVWKKTLAASSMMLIATMLCSCVPTPDVPPVISRAQGLPEGTAISAVTDQEPKVLDVPARWSEIMDRNEGKIQIQADLAITLEPVINTPVYEFAQTEFSAELLSGLCSYFSRGQKLYRALPMTKEELKVQYRKMEEKKGDFSSGSYYLAEKMRRLEQLIEEAPEVKPEKTYV
ncbi:MAG: DUF6034 family protein [Lachnospiraceae bacterium]|nr:DUF6034 family protein [Lachnospiraceae bacterium]